MMKIMKNLLFYSLLFKITVGESAIDQEYDVQKNDKYYAVLELSASASLEEIEQAYYIHTTLCHEKIGEMRPYAIESDNQQHRVEIYGRFGEIRGGGYYKWDFIPSNWARDQLSQSRKKLHDVRQAYEILTGRILDKVELPVKNLDTYRLDQEILYHEIERRGIQDLQKYIQAQRFMNKRNNLE